MTTLRSLAREPGCFALAVLTLTLAVGANLVVFTIVNAIWLRPRPVRAPNRVVMVMGNTDSSGTTENFFFAELGLQRQVRDVPAFEQVAGQVMTSGYNQALTPRIVIDGVGHPVETLAVTSEYFGVLGIPIRGRDFTLDDDRFTAKPVAIISDRLWKSAFGGAQTYETESGSYSIRDGFDWIGEDYFKVLGVRVIAGRALTSTDFRPPRAPAPVVITASFAGALWPGQSPLGRHFRGGPNDPYKEVVGVVEDFAFGSMRFDPRSVVLRAANLEMSTAMKVSLAVRANEPETLVEPLRRIIAQAAPDASQVTIVTGRDAVAADLGRERLGAWFFSAFGLVSIGLGIAGVFGMVAYIAESRRREFGIRAALGANAAQLIRRVMREGLMPVAAGTGAGLICAAWLGKLTQPFLLGVNSFDPGSFVSAGLLLMISGILAGLIAALRLRRIAPSEALRAE